MNKIVNILFEWIVEWNEEAEKDVADDDEAFNKFAFRKLKESKTISFKFKNIRKTK